MTNVKQYLIADSGGTKTDWCYVNAIGEKLFFTSESYHPVNWSKEFKQRIEKFWQDKEEMKSAEFFFFGSGCLNRVKSKELEAFFRSIGFNSVTVKSDLHAAGLAALGSKEGHVAIMGTGSVLFYWKDKEVSNIIGGKGHEIGDEGSGYYFGKLVLEAYTNDELNEEQRSMLSANNPIEKKFEDQNINLKFEVAEIAFTLRSYDKLFSKWHQLNFRTFFQTHLHEMAIDNIWVVGSYAFHYQHFLLMESKKINVNVKKIIHKPIALLVDQIVPFIE